MNKNESNPVKTNKAKKFFMRRQFRYGWYATLSTILFIALVIVLNVIVDAAETKWALKIDATGNAITDFSDKTYETIDGVGEDIYVHMVYANNSSRTEKMNVEEIAAKYHARNGHIIIDTIDPNTEPGRVNKYKTTTVTSIAEGSLIVTNADESRVKVVNASDVYSKELDWYTYYTTGEEKYTTAFDAEGQLTSALMYVTSTDTPRVFFLAGHNEVASSYCGVLTSSLRNENYDVQELTLGQTDATLGAGDTLVVFMPELDITDDDYATIKAFLDNGGRMLYVSDPSMDLSKTPNFTSLLDYFGFKYESGYVIEDETSTSNWINSPLYLVPNVDSESEITKSLTSSRIILPNSAAAIQTPDPRSGFAYTNLLTTSDKAYLKEVTSESNAYTKGENDKTGTFTLAMSMLRQKDVSDSTQDTRIVVLGNPYLLVDSYMNSTNNLDFIMNTVDWLVNRETSVYVRSKSLLSTTLSIPDSGTTLLLFIVIVVAIPVAALLAGIIVWIRRRRL